MAFGAELSLSISAIWILGGVVGGYMATESIFRLKRVSRLVLCGIKSK
ncbi:MAG: hypothetical protein JNM24_00265 [Bdellovibrionaceae bacterium]|nr:hypothetical protein [Pseudobdellovibrionaceae bacterium]